MYHFLTVRNYAFFLTDYVLHVPENKQSIIPLLFLFDRACLLSKEST